jgi:hypothetical protein
LKGYSSPDRHVVSAFAIMGPATAVLAMLASVAVAQELVIPPVAYPVLARSAQSAEGLVPQGWRLEHKAVGDLNNDGRPDLALVLRAGDPANVIDNQGLGPRRFDTNPRLLIVAFALPGGGYRRVLQNHTLMPRPDNPAMEDVLQDPNPVTIAKGTLRVSMNVFVSAGGWTTYSVKHTFQLRSGQFRLIGFDRSSIARNSGNQNEISVNFLTGKAKISKGNISRDTMDTSWTSLPKRKLLSISQVGNGLEFTPLEIP